MAVAVAMVAFAQTTEPAIESVPASDQPAALNSSPTGDENSTDKDTSVQSDPPVGPTPAAAAEVEIQRRFNELQRELLDDRADYIDRWLIAVTIVLAFFGILGFKRFREIEAEARKSVEAAKRYEADAKDHAERIEALQGKAVAVEAAKRYEADAKDHAERIEALQGKAVADVQRIRDLMTAEVAAQNPAEANQAVKDARENPEASLTDKAIADAVSLQQQGKRDDAIEKWRAIAHVVEGSDNDLAARAWFSVGYLIQDEDPEDALADYAEAIRLKPDYAGAFYNRGVAKAKLGRYEDALADFAEAIRLKPDHASPYYNLGIVKAKLGRYEDALADYAEAIRLKPDHAGAFYNRGVAKAKLGRYEDALADFAEAIRLKPDLADAYNNRGVAKAELGRYEDALADYAEAIRLKPDLAEAYGNRGNAKNALGLKDEARKDFETTLELARNANNAGAVAHAEQSLRDLDDGA